METQHKVIFNTESNFYNVLYCVCVCVSWRPTYGSSSPGLLHHFPILFQQSVSNLLRLAALHLSLCTSHIPVPLLVSFSLNLTLSSLHALIPSYLSCRQFPLSAPSLSFLLSLPFCSDIHLLPPPSLCSSGFYLHLTQPFFLLILCLPLFMSILSLSLLHQCFFDS